MRVSHVTHLLVYGGVFAGIGGLFLLSTGQNRSPASPLPIPDFAKSGAETCAEQGPYAQACHTIKRHYPAFDPRMIRPLRAFAEKHNVRLSELLALCLIESYCNPLSKSRQSSAMGPFHYLEANMIALARNSGHMAALRQILPERHAAIDQMTQRIDRFEKERRTVLHGLFQTRAGFWKTMNAESKGQNSLIEKKRALDAARARIKELKERNKGLVSAFRDDLLHQYSDIVFVLQMLDVLKVAQQRPFAGGQFYLAHFFGPKDAEALESMRVSEKAAPAAAPDLVFVESINGFRVGDIKGFPRRYGVTGFAIPKNQEHHGFIPALAQMAEPAKANWSRFFEIMDVVVDGKTIKALRPRSAEEVSAFIRREWEDRLKRVEAFERPPSASGKKADAGAVRPVLHTRWNGKTLEIRLAG